ncbi:hypothetical protein EK21DRAFT_111988 [Setomelanomma holmii]|uniref:Uncharacterized protein n=1 Tax=Setomelanomma holmii TaxID=210430 RepID=A0A9P4LKJ9_9PLEO|nr:hypothetical protein EK21DRAFT_111988 [Setomelanomma holmii]
MSRVPRIRYRTENRPRSVSAKQENARSIEESEEEEDEPPRNEVQQQRRVFSRSPALFNYRPRTSDVVTRSPMSPSYNPHVSSPSPFDQSDFDLFGPTSPRYSPASPG